MFDMVYATFVGVLWAPFSFLLQVCGVSPPDLIDPVGRLADEPAQARCSSPDCLNISIAKPRIMATMQPNTNPPNRPPAVR